MAQRTALYDRHREAGGKIVDFAGFDLPVEYPQGLVAEHLAVRKAAGVFDVSHMGEFKVSGAGALDWLNQMLTNAFDSLKPGRVRYTLMCNEAGGTIDDLIVYCVGEEDYLLVVNAANREKDFAWLSEHVNDNVTLEDVSDNISLLALQGPASQAVLEALANSELPTKNFSFKQDVAIAGVNCWVARTGYTGEYGYEIFIFSPEDTVTVWDALLASDKAEVLPCGLGARDTLRLEAAMPLYGHELTEEITPLEAGLDFAVKLDKEFVGKDGIVAALPLERTRVGLKALDKGIVREGVDLYLGDELVGQTSSGTYAPLLEQAIAMALVQVNATEPGTVLDAQVRKRRIRMEIVELPFYKAEK